MGAGVARQCSRNRCLARWTVRSLVVPPRPSKRANSKKDLVTGPIGVSVPYRLLSQLAGFHRGTDDRIIRRI